MARSRPNDVLISGETEIYVGICAARLHDAF